MYTSQARVSFLQAQKSWSKIGNEPEKVRDSQGCVGTQSSTIVRCNIHEGLVTDLVQSQSYQCNLPWKPLVRSVAPSMYPRDHARLFFFASVTMDLDLRMKSLLAFSC